MRIPDFQDLLARNLIDDDPDKCRLAVENCLLPITSGVEAIGSLLASYDNEGLPKGAIQDLGYLLAFLAKMSGDLQHMKADAEFMLRERMGSTRKEVAA